MAKKNKFIVIDLSEWTTQKAFADQKGVKKNTVSTWIKRGQIKTWDIPELGLKLVSPASLSVGGKQAP